MNFHVFLNNSRDFEDVYEFHLFETFFTSPLIVENEIDPDAMSFRYWNTFLTSIISFSKSFSETEIPIDTYPHKNELI